MTTMQAELNDALIAAGAPEDKARAGAIAVADVRGIERAQDDIKALRTDVTELKADMRLLKWMVSFNLAATVGILMLLKQ